MSPNDGTGRPVRHSHSRLSSHFEGVVKDHLPEMTHGTSTTIAPSRSSSPRKRLLDSRFPHSSRRPKSFRGSSPTLQGGTAPSGGRASNNALISTRGKEPRSGEGCAPHASPEYGSVALVSKTSTSRTNGDYRVSNLSGHITPGSLQLAIDAKLLSFDAKVNADPLNNCVLDLKISNGHLDVNKKVSVETRKNGVLDLKLNGHAESKDNGVVNIKVNGHASKLLNGLNGGLRIPDLRSRLGICLGYNGSSNGRADLRLNGEHKQSLPENRLIETRHGLDKLCGETQLQITDKDACDQKKGFEKDVVSAVDSRVSELRQPPDIRHSSRHSMPNGVSPLTKSFSINHNNNSKNSINNNSNDLVQIFSNGNSDGNSGTPGDPRSSEIPTRNPSLSGHPIRQASLSSSATPSRPLIIPSPPPIRVPTYPNPELLSKSRLSSSVSDVNRVLCGRPSVSLTPVTSRIPKLADSTSSTQSSPRSNCDRKKAVPSNSDLDSISGSSITSQSNPSLGLSPLTSSTSSSCSSYASSSDAFSSRSNSPVTTKQTDSQSMCSKKPSSPFSIPELKNFPMLTKSEPSAEQSGTIRFPALAPKKDTSEVCRWKDCNEVMDPSTSLLEHIQAVHVEGQLSRESFRCLWVGCKVFERSSCSVSWLERHVLTHGGHKPFKCIVGGCGQRFTSQTALGRHVNHHFNNTNAAATTTTTSCSSNHNAPTSLSNAAAGSINPSVGVVTGGGVGGVGGGGGGSIVSAPSTRLPVTNNAHHNNQHHHHHHHHHHNHGSPTKLLRRHGRKLRVRRRPWSARMFDFFDVSVMEKLQWGLVCVNNATVGSASRKFADGHDLPRPNCTSLPSIASTGTSTPDLEEKSISETDKTLPSVCTRTTRRSRPAALTTATRSSSRNSDAKSSSSKNIGDDFEADKKLSNTIDESKSMNSDEKHHHTRTRSAAAAAAASVSPDAGEKCPSLLKSTSSDSNSREKETKISASIPSSFSTPVSTRSTRSTSLDASQGEPKEEAFGAQNSNTVPVREKEKQQMMQYPTDACGAVYQEDCITLYPTVTGRRVTAEGQAEELVQWSPPEVLCDGWLPAGVAVPHTVPLASLPHSARMSVARLCFPSLRSSPETLPSGSSRRKRVPVRQKPYQRSPDASSQVSTSPSVCSVSTRQSSNLNSMSLQCSPENQASLMTDGGCSMSLKKEPVNGFGVLDRPIKIEMDLSPDDISDLGASVFKPGINQVIEKNGFSRTLSEKMNSVNVVGVPKTKDERSSTENPSEQNAFFETVGNKNLFSKTFPDRTLVQKTGAPKATSERNALSKTISGRNGLCKAISDRSVASKAASEKTVSTKSRSPRSSRDDTSKPSRLAATKEKSFALPHVLK